MPGEGEDAAAWAAPPRAEGSGVTTGLWRRGGGNGEEDGGGGGGGGGLGALLRSALGRMLGCGSQQHAAEGGARGWRQGE